MLILVGLCHRPRQTLAGFDSQLLRNPIEPFNLGNLTEHRRMKAHNAHLNYRR